MVNDIAASVFLLEDKVESWGRGEGEQPDVCATWRRGAT
jgi:hypothetical protein